MREVRAMHTCKIVYDPSVLGRRWGVYCEACKKVIAACVTEQEARDCLEGHEYWQKAKQDWLAREKQ